MFDDVEKARAIYALAQGGARPVSLARQPTPMTMGNAQFRYQCDDGHDATATMR
jgi:hypothetical protein